VRENYEVNAGEAIIAFKLTHDSMNGLMESIRHKEYFY